MTAKPLNYVTYQKEGILTRRADKAGQILLACRLCPRRCGVNRLEQEKGYCAAGDKAIVASFCPHFGEEPPLVGTNGSGTIFFSFCNLMCCFCQNYDISHKGEGEAADPSQLAAVMLHLKNIGCHNINFVTPTHVVPQILAALDIAADSRNGLDIPLVYNSSGYDSVDTLKLLDGIIDIYMPDFKFWDAAVAEMTCEAPDYPETARAALKEMHRQTGDLEIDQNGIARSGLLVRHLVMPENLSGTENVMTFLKEEISADTYVNVMSQYRPVGEAHKFKSLSRSVSAAEFREAVRIANDLNLNIIS